MYEIKEPSRERCEGYLKRFHPELKLGAYIQSGGAGVVYELIGTKTPTVVKIVDSCYMAQTGGCRAEDKEKRRAALHYVQREIEQMRRLKGCAHIMPVYDAMTIPDPDGIAESNLMPVTLIIMPKLMPLMWFTANKRKLTSMEILQLGLDICEALRSCTEQKIIHRDVKPANIFVCQKDGKLRFVLGDFGISRRVENLGVEIVTEIGSGYYQAPEFRSPIRYYNSDIYSLGVTLFYLLTGTYPLLKPDQAAGNTTVLQIDRVVPEFREVLEKAMQIDPELRYHGPTQMIDALRKLPVIRPTVGPELSGGLMAAKEALCHGKLQEALYYAHESYLKRERGSRRFLAYCLNRVDPEDERIMDMLDECFNEGDPTGILIRGMLLKEKGELQMAVRDIQDAAVDRRGCVPAWYYYGRFLYYGDCEGIQQDRSLGILYIQRAAEQQFYPALRILKRIRGELSELTLPPYLEQLLQKEYSRTDPRESGDIIRFL